MKDLIERLEAAAAAYPEDVFGAVSDKDRAEHGVAVQRAAAQMGRHLAPLLSEAATALRAVREAPVVGGGWVLVALRRVEDYEDVHPELLAEDAIGDRWPEYRTLTDTNCRLVPVGEGEA